MKQFYDNADELIADFPENSVVFVTDSQDILSSFADVSIPASNFHLDFAVIAIVQGDAENIAIYGCSRLKMDTDFLRLWDVENGIDHENVSYTEAEIREKYPTAFPFRRSYLIVENPNLVFETFLGDTYYLRKNLGFDARTHTIKERLL